MIKVIDIYQGHINTLDGELEDVKEEYRKWYPQSFDDLRFEEVATDEKS